MKMLKPLMKAKNLKMKELGDMIGVAEGTISLYASGKRFPSPEMLCALADALDCSLDMLIRGKEKDRPGGRSLQELINDYENLSDEVLERNIAVSQAVLAERRLHARIQTEKKETQ